MKRLFAGLPVIAFVVAAMLPGHCAAGNFCTADNQCSVGNWCYLHTNTCTPDLPNGVPIPDDQTHTNPILNGMCTAAAGALVCISGVCDTADNRCGLLNGDGACTVGNGGTVCRSGACDSNDNRCGYANSDGPCTQATGPIVCRSGVCSASGTCEASGGCNLDADCSSGNWCSESTHTCNPRLVNGLSIPVDPPHSNPTLDGTCTAAAGTLVCLSSVCDTTNNTCGYLDGDGFCTLGNADVVCDSGACSVTGICEPAGGCLINADCAPGNVCTAAFMCTPGTVDISVAAVAGPNPVEAGSDLTYTITVSNGGTISAASVFLSDTVPTGTTFVSLAAAAGWSCNALTPGTTGTASCFASALDPGSAVFTLVVQIDPASADGTVISNTVTASSATSDTNLLNNSASAATTVFLPIFKDGFE